MKRILDIFKKFKEKDSLINELKIRDYNKTPVFLFFFTLIILINFISFILGYIKLFTPINEIAPWNDKIHLLFGANQSFLFLEYFHFWRIFTFPFFQNVTSWFDSILSFFFVFLTYRTLGFYFEVFLKPKKTLFILLTGIPLIGMISSVFSISDDIFLFGSEWICWLLMGGFLFVILNKKESTQSIKLIKWTLFKISIILIGILIYRYTYSDIGLTTSLDNNFNFKQTFYIIVPIITLGIGFFLTSIANYNEIKDKSFLTVSIIFITVLILILLIFYFNYYVELFDGPIKKTTSLSQPAKKIIKSLKYIFSI